MAAPDLHSAIQFFVDWRSPARASELLLKRHLDLDGNLFEHLTLVAEALLEGFPLAATLALRAMIDFTLRHGRSSRYAHCARHLEACATMAARVESFGEFEPHGPGGRGAAFCSRLIWPLLDGLRWFNDLVRHPRPPWPTR